MTHLNNLFKELRQVQNNEPLDWGGIRTIYLQIDAESRTADQKKAMQGLKEAGDSFSLNSAISHAERAFNITRPTTGHP